MKHEARVAEHREPGDDAEQQRRASGVGRSATSSVSSTSAAATSWSTISRLTCTSCQTRYGFSVAIAAATRPARAAEHAAPDLVDEQRGRDRDERSARVPIDHQFAPKIQ